MQDNTKACDRSDLLLCGRALLLAQPAEHFRQVAVAAIFRRRLWRMLIVVLDFERAAKLNEQSRRVLVPLRGSLARGAAAVREAAAV